MTNGEIQHLGLNVGLKRLEFTNQSPVYVQTSIILVAIVILGFLSHQSANAISGKVNIFINTTSSIVPPSTHISNAYMYLNTTDGHYHVTGIIKNIIDETIDDTSVFGTFFDMATKTLLTTFDINTGYTSKQANKFSDMTLSLQ